MHTSLVFMRGSFPIMYSCTYMSCTQSTLLGRSGQPTQGPENGVSLQTRPARSRLPRPCSLAHLFRILPGASCCSAGIPHRAQKEQSTKRERERERERERGEREREREREREEERRHDDRPANAAAAAGRPGAATCLCRRLCRRPPGRLRPQPAEGEGRGAAVGVVRRDGFVRPAVRRGRAGRRRGPGHLAAPVGPDAAAAHFRRRRRPRRVRAAVVAVGGVRRQGHEGLRRGGVLRGIPLRGRVVRRGGRVLPGYDGGAHGGAHPQTHPRAHQSPPAPPPPVREPKPAAVPAGRHAGLPQAVRRRRLRSGRADGPLRHGAVPLQQAGAHDRARPGRGHQPQRSPPLRR